MAARAIWTGNVTFGMVTFAVRLSPAASSKDLAFNELHKESHERLKRIRWSPSLQREVRPDEVTKAFEYAKGQYVEMTDEDFEKVPIPSKKTIEITKFVPSDQIDPVFYDKAYLLEAEDNVLKPYLLFMHALKSKGLVALAKVTMRKREELCLLRAVGANLLMETLYYGDEVRVELDKKEATVELNDAEKQMAEMLVDYMKGEFNPEEYKDEYRGALMTVIEAKKEGREVVAAPEAPTQVMDLMEALRASLEAAKARQAS